MVLTVCDTNLTYGQTKNSILCKVKKENKEREKLLGIGANVLGVEGKGGGNTPLFASNTVS